MADGGGRAAAGDAGDWLSSCGRILGIASRVAAFHRGLKELDFVEGRNVAIEYRWAENQFDRLPELAGDLIRRGVAVIAAPAGADTTRVVKGLTTTIPIVFSTGVDPVQTVGPKPQPAWAAMRPVSLTWQWALGVSGSGFCTNSCRERCALRSLSHPPLPLVVYDRRGEVGGRGDRDANRNPHRHYQSRHRRCLCEPWAKAGRCASGGSSNIVSTRRVQLVTLAARHAVPTMYYQREYVEAGGLMSYGSSIIDRERLLGVYTGRILKGEKPADLPILRAVKFEFVINLQTAKTIGLDVPSSLLARADEVIE